MKALSIRQPWAWMIIAGHKDIENRSWPTEFRGRFYVHAGVYRPRDTELAAIERLAGVKIPVGELRFGGIIGEVDLVDCVEKHRSRWFDRVWGNRGFVLANPKATKFVPCRGQLGFFEPKLSPERVDHRVDHRNHSAPVRVPIIVQPELL